MRRCNQQRNGEENGITLVEVLVAIVLIGIMAMAGISNLFMALKTSKLTEANHAANSLAISKVEELASIDTLDLNATYNATENSVPWSDLAFTFTRTTTVVVNADSSRTVTVTVTSNSAAVPTSVDFTTTFALWE